MNTHAEYRRHVHQPETTSLPETAAREDISHLARHGDPSVARPGLTTPTDRHVVWVRPTEVHAYAGTAIGRGNDLQAELTRRARRAPLNVTRAARRAIPDLKRHAPTSSARQEGLQL